MNKVIRAKNYYEFLTNNNAFTYGKMMNEENQQVAFMEHPFHGDEHEVIVAFPDLGIAFDSGFFDCDDMRNPDSAAYRPFFVDGQFMLGFELEYDE